MRRSSVVTYVAIAVAVAGSLLQAGLARQAGSGMGASALPIWNDCGGPCSIPEGGFFSAGIPQTFRMHLDVQANGTTDQLGLGVLTSYGFADFIDCFQSQSYNDAFRSYHCLQDAAKSPESHLWTGDVLHIDFQDSEGCAGYIVVLVSEGGNEVPITPYETLSYKPVGLRTGICSKDPYL